MIKEQKQKRSNDIIYTYKPEEKKMTSKYIDKRARIGQ